MHLHRNWIWIFIVVMLSGGHPASGNKGPIPLEQLDSAAEQGWHRPCDSIVGDLLDFLPGYMKEKQIPGCAISLVYDHRIVWTEGFGTRNTLTHKPVEGESVFEVASNSKFITACVTMLLVKQGTLSPDAPLNNYLSEPWLSDSEYRDLITLRQVLSHTSGLGHNDMSREILFPPGTRYQYSNLGFTYLQHVIEELTGRSLEQLASDMLFEPMAMSNTSFTNNKRLRSKLANGHVPGKYLLGLTGIFFLVSLLVTWVPGILIFRLIRKQWLPAKRTLVYGFLLSILLWVVITFTFFGIAGWLKYAWLIVLFGTTFLLLVFLLFLAARILSGRLPFLTKRTLNILLFLWMLIAASGLVVLTRSIQNIPVPKWPAIRPMAPASLRTTAPDMANFLLGISEPDKAGFTLCKQMLDPQISLHPSISWGLGTGILHSPPGDALWQWGQNVDFQSLVIFWPEKGLGMTILTNSEWGEPDVAIEIAQEALGLNLEPLIRASHLEFSGD